MKAILKPLVLCALSAMILAVVIPLEATAKRKPKEIKPNTELIAQLNSWNYEFVAEKAPRVNRNNFTAYYWMRISGDKMSMNIPFMGYGTTNVGYGRETPHEFSGTISGGEVAGDLTDKKLGLTVSMNVSASDGHKYRVIFNVYNDSQARLLIRNLTYRSEMEFYGYMKENGLIE